MAMARYGMVAVKVQANSRRKSGKCKAMLRDRNVAANVNNRR